MWALLFSFAAKCFAAVTFIALVVKISKANLRGYRRKLWAAWHAHRFTVCGPPAHRLMHGGGLSEGYGHLYGIAARIRSPFTRAATPVRFRVAIIFERNRKVGYRYPGGPVFRLAPT